MWLGLGGLNPLRPFFLASSGPTGHITYGTSAVCSSKSTALVTCKQWLPASRLPAAMAGAASLPRHDCVRAPHRVGADPALGCGCLSASYVR